MTRARVRALVVAILLLIGTAIAIAFSQRQVAAPAGRPLAERPTLLMLTSLPLVFGETFAVDGGSPTLSALGSRYRVVPISVTDDKELARGELLLMAHPLAQPAEDLVALDAWVRRGGRVLLLADPALDWPSRRPLGDPLRPPPMFTDTGLLGHWGVTLETPERRGPQDRTLGGRQIKTMSPGTLSGACAISPDRFVADCPVGQGRAIIVADADFLNVEAFPEPAERNLDALLAELADLEKR